MEQLSELLPVFGFLLSLGLFGYGLKKVLLKVEKDTSNNQENTPKIKRLNKHSKIMRFEIQEIFIKIMICINFLNKKNLN